MDADEKGFGGRAVVTFESRKVVEMASLIERFGGVPVVAPTLREVRAEDAKASHEFAGALRSGAFDALVLMTGVGTRALLEEMAPELDAAGFSAELSRLRVVVARGPKPAQVLREIGAPPFLLAKEPNTWRDVMAALSGWGTLAGLRVAVQEHGVPSTELYDALRAAGAVVTPVPVYRWALPADTGPLRAALHRLALDASIALFTSRAQVEHALTIAAEEGIEARVRESLRRGVVGSIGPVCTEMLCAEGLPPDVEPTHSKMGHLVKEASEVALEILRRKSAESCVASSKEAGAR